MDEIHAQFETDDPLAPLDTGEPGFRLTGLRDVSGTFSGTLDEGVSALLAGPTNAHMLYIYGPDPNTPWWKHWFYKIRWRLFDIKYPTVVLASGPAEMTFDGPVEDGDDVVFNGEFKSTGHWDFK